jgi:hypothetical protein
MVTQPLLLAAGMDQQGDEDDSGNERGYPGRTPERNLTGRAGRQEHHSAHLITANRCTQWVGGERLSG